jgi:hypothetical protein
VSDILDPATLHPEMKRCIAEIERLRGLLARVGYHEDDGRQLELARADTARLDWLAENSERFCEWQGDKWCAGESHGIDGPPSPWAIGDTPRAAIDAAMREAKP